jgi:HEPN domain-containing protein
MISNGALEYLKAAKKLQENPLVSPKPFWFCVFQSIELSLKSFLRGKGFAKKKLKESPYGHNLIELMSAAETNDLQSLIELTEEDRAILSVTGSMYSSKVFQYTEVGWKSLPYSKDALKLAERLYESTREFAESMREFHHGKDTAITKEG